MFQEERIAEILQLVRKGKRFTVRELAVTFEVSESTIRRDLALLETKGYIVRTHGGAINRESMANETLYLARKSEHQKEKAEIAKKAYTFIGSNEVVFLDAGTTTLELAKELGNFRKRLVVITHDLEIAYLLREFGNIELVLLGGTYIESSRIFGGAMTRGNLATFHADKAFIAINGISGRYGLTTPFIEEAQIKRDMLEASNETFVLADHSKFDRAFVKRVCTLKEVDHIITDSGIGPDVEKKYKGLFTGLLNAGH